MRRNHHHRRFHVPLLSWRNTTLLLSVSQQGRCFLYFSFATQSLPDLSRRCTSIGTSSSLMCSGKLRQSLLLQARECTRRWDGKAPILGPILSNTWGSRSKGAQRGPSCVPVPLPSGRAGCLLPSRGRAHWSSRLSCGSPWHQPLHMWSSCTSPGNHLLGGC